MASMIEEIGDYLAAQGVGVLASSLFLGGGLPDEPDAAVSVTEYQGEAPGFVHGTAGVSLERRRFQVACRALSLSAAMAKAQAIDAALVLVKNTTLGGTYYVRVEPLQSPFPLGKDANGRYRVVCNYRVEKTTSA